MKRFVGVSITLLVLIFTAQASLLAQTPNGTILGTVRDPSGAVIPSARVRLLNQNTTFVRSTTTNLQGDYLFAEVPPGPYTLTVEASGFKKFEQQDIQLFARQTLRLDAKLVVGTAQQAVTVTGQAPVVNSETASIGEGYSPAELKNYYQPLPMFRYTAELIGNYSLQSVGIGSAQYKVNGARANQVRVVQDGRVAYAYWGVPATVTQEMKLESVNAPAEFTEPATISVSTKSGTNTLHGDAEFILMHPALNALGPNPQTRPHATGSYNASFVGSGPVVIPKVYDGRDRTFWLVTFERSESKDYQWPPLINVPTALMRQGDFSQYRDSNGNVIPIIDPLTGTQFQGNVIPPDRISSVSKNILSLYPLPNRGDPTSTFQNYTTIGHQFYSFNNFFMRFDQKISDYDTLTFAYKLNHQSARFDTAASGFQKVPGLYYAVQKQTVPGYSFAETHIFSPRIVNEFRFAYDHYDQPSGEDVKGQTLLQAWGIQGIDSSLDFTGVPNILINGFAGLGQVYNDNHFTEDRFSYLDNLSIQLGRHTIKTGFDYYRINDSTVGAGGNVFGTYSFTGRFTRGTLPSAGDSLADFLLGYPDSTSRFTPRLAVKPFNFIFGAYVQDDWKVSPRLTVNLGLRYDLSGAPVDRSGLYFSFDPKNGALVFPSQFAIDHVSPLFNTLIPLELASAAGYPAHLINTDKNNFVPRIGIAFRPFNNAKTVIRAAYGIYTTGKLGVASNGAAGNYLNTGGPFALTESFISTQPGGGTVGEPTLSFPDPFLESGGTAAASYSTSFVNPDYHDPYMQQWNFTIEQEVWNTGLRFSYVGSKSTNLTWAHDVNLPPPSTTAFDISSCGTPGPRPTDTCRRLYYGFTSVSYTDQGGNDSYNSAQIEFTRPMASGFRLHGGWIWASEITDVEEQTAYAGPVGINPYDRNYNRGPANNIPRHRFEIDATWEAPVGHGKRFLGSVPGVLNEIVGGWVFSGYANFMSGTPFSVTYSGSDPSGMGIFSGRADRIAPGKVYHPSQDHWFDPSAFVTPPCGAGSTPGECLPIGRFGNSGRNILIGPTTNFNYGRTEMLGIHKNFPIYGERVNFRVSAYFINPFNRSYLSTPNSNISDLSNVGRQTRYGNRSIQLGGRLDF